MEWQWHQLDHMQISCTLFQTDNHARTSSLNFLQTACSFWCQTNTVKALKAILWAYHHITTTTVLRPFFRVYPGEPVPVENFWTLWCKEKLTEADTPTIWLGATPSELTSAHLHQPPIFYRPDALPAAQPTVSKHWRHLAHSD